MATIDLVDNFQVTRKQMSKQVDRPSLQSFRKDSVVGVGTRAHADVPGLHNRRWEHAAIPFAGRVWSKTNNTFLPFPTRFSPHRPGPSSAQGLPWLGGCHSAGWQPAHAEQQLDNSVFCLLHCHKKRQLWSNNKWGAFSFLNAVWYLLHLVRQFAEIGASNFPGAKLGDLETADDVLQGGRYYKVLLLQTELLSFKELWVRTHICVFIPRRQRSRDFFKHTIWNISDCCSRSWTADSRPHVKSPTTLITLTTESCEVQTHRYQRSVAYMQTPWQIRELPP